MGEERMCKVCGVLKCCINEGWHLKWMGVPLNRQDNICLRDRNNLMLFSLWKKIWCKSLLVMFDDRTYTELGIVSPQHLPWHSKSSAWSDIKVKINEDNMQQHIPDFFSELFCPVKVLSSAVRRDSWQDKRPSKQSLGFKILGRFLFQRKCLPFHESYFWKKE